MSDELLNTLRRLEEQMHGKPTRQDPNRLDALLHPDFEEFGRSGAHYDRAEILEELGSEALVPRVRAGDYSLSLLGEDVALLTYESAHLDEGGRPFRRTLRSSLWVRTADGWQIRFHQGTPAD
jgi:hypothetical protein